MRLYHARPIVAICDAAPMVKSLPHDWHMARWPWKLIEMAAPAKLYQELYIFSRRTVGHRDVPKLSLARSTQHRYVTKLVLSDPD